MRYFDHDTGAWKDEKIAALCYDGGLQAYGLYFVVLELIYEEEGPVNLAETEPLTKSVARWFGVGSEWVSDTVEEMCKCGLLKKMRTKKSGLMVTSERAEENIKRYREKCETARQNGKKGGRKPSGNQDANRVGSESLTGRKAKKRKESVSVLTKEPNTRTAGAVAGRPAPRCPKCGGKLWENPQTGRLECDRCLESYTREEVA